MYHEVVPHGYQINTELQVITVNMVEKKQQKCQNIKSPLSPENILK